MKQHFVILFFGITFLFVTGCGESPPETPPTDRSDQSVRALRGDNGDYTTPIAYDCTLCLNPGPLTDAEKLIREFGEEARKMNCSFRVVIDPPRNVYTCESKKVTDGIEKCNLGVENGGGDPGACSCGACDCPKNVFGIEATACWKKPTSAPPRRQ